MCFCEKSQSKPGKTPRSVWNVSIVVNMNSTSPLHPACKCLCSSCVQFFPMLRIKTAQVHRSKQHQSFLNRSLKVTNRQITKKRKKDGAGGENVCETKQGKNYFNLKHPVTSLEVVDRKNIHQLHFFFLLRPLLGKKHPKGSPKINQQVHHECPVCKCVYGRKKENDVKIWGKCYTTWCTRCLDKASG